ncbi:MAG: (Fe-S)-binding protein [Bacteroidota bacterium]
MKIALSIPCFIDQFYPQVGVAAVELLEKLNIDFEVPENQTCCGQPMANSGFEDKAKNTYHHFIDLFKDYDKTVMISGSCTHHVQHNYTNIPQTEGVKNVRNNIEDISQFILNNYIDKIEPVHFPYKVALHTGCHSLRGQRFGTSSELAMEKETGLEGLLKNVSGIEVIPLSRPNECCGFGGTFSVVHEAISIKMGKDKLNDVADKEVEYLISNDMSCLMHLEGIIKKENRNIKVAHILELLNGSLT